MAKQRKAKTAEQTARPPDSKPVDPRFAAAYNDPRFQRFPAPRRAVAIDDRFAGTCMHAQRLLGAFAATCQHCRGMFEDPEFQTRGVVDKRGRKVKTTKHKDDMRRYYRLQREGDKEEEAVLATAPDAAEPSEGAPKAPSRNTSAKSQQQAVAPVPTGERHAKEAEPSDSSSEEEDDTGAVGQAAKRWAYLRGVGQPSDSSSSSSSDEEEEEAGVQSEEADSNAEAQAAAIAQWGVGAMAANPEEQVPTCEETRRLAAVDLDWEHVRAVDIYAALRSFLPKSGSIKRVTVYPSDYGLQRMKEEASSGPQGIYRPLQNGKVQGAAEPGFSSDEDEGDAGSDSDASEQAEEEEQASDVSEEEEALEDPAAGDEDDDSGSEKDEVDQARLRLYERSKLRYYYAIVEFDSVATAARVYQDCDGLEFELSACKMDLRFVPDEQSFEGRQVRDWVASVPEGYVAPNFQTQALQHTNVKLTWDKDDTERKRALQKRATKDEIRDSDFKAYLASDSEDSGADEEAARQQQEKYRALLMGGGGNGAKGNIRKGGKVWGAAADDEDEQPSDEDEAAERRRPSNRDMMEMELTWKGGLEELGQRLASKKRDKAARQAETVWEAYQRRRREKRAAAKAKGKFNVDSDSDDVSDPNVASGSDEDRGGQDLFFQHDDDPFNDPFFQDDAAAAPRQPTKPSDAEKKKAEKAAEKAKQAREKEEEARRVAELQLLMMDEEELQRPRAAAGGAAAGDKPAKLGKKEKARLKKAKRLKERQVASDDEDLGDAGEAGGGFVADTSDPRFGALLTSDAFALDPTDPRFKATASTAAIQQARARHRTRQPPKAGGAAREAGGAGEPLQALVASLKRRAGTTTAAEGDTAPRPKKKKKQLQH